MGQSIPWIVIGWIISLDMLVHKYKLLVLWISWTSGKCCCYCYHYYCCCVLLLSTVLLFILQLQEFSFNRRKRWITLSERVDFETKCLSESRISLIISFRFFGPLSVTSCKEVPYVWITSIDIRFATVWDFFSRIAYTSSQLVIQSTGYFYMDLKGLKGVILEVSFHQEGGPFSSALCLAHKAFINIF